MENEENICFDVEPEEIEESQPAGITLEEKLQNTLAVISKEKNNYNNFDRAKSFIKNCLIPEKMSASDAESYIKFRLAKEFRFEGRDGNKMVTDLKKIYENELKYQAQKQLEEAKKASGNNTKANPVRTGVVNDVIMPWEKYVYPDGYSSKNGKIVKTEDRINPKTLEPEAMDKEVSLTPFILCGKSAGEKKYYKVRYELNDSYNEFVVPMDDLLDNNTMQRALTSHGINIPASLKFEANDYIGAFIHQLGNNLKTISVTAQNGWNEDFSVFAIGNNGITKDGIMPIVSLVDSEKHIKPFVQKGNFECWKEGVTPVLSNPKPRFLFYHGMSSALIRILGVEQDIVDVVGNTSTGKSGSLAVVSSAIGNPSVKPDGYALEVGNSDNPLMAHAAGLRDMPVIFEEATGEEKRKAVIKAAYNIANGVDKTRSQKNGKVRNDVLEIRSNVLISCEQPISEEVKTAGGKQRIKDLKNVLEDSIPNGEMIDRTKKIIFNNYGFFFPLYIQKIMSNIPRVKALYEQATEKITKDFGNIPKECAATANRSRNVFAAKLVAGYLCEEVFREIGIPAKTEQETEKLANEMFKECVLNNPVELDYVKAIRVILAWRASTDEFIKTDDINHFKEKSGEETEKELKIIGTKFTAKMNSAGLSNNVLSDFYKKGISDSEYFKSVKINNKTCAAIKLNIKKMESIISEYESRDPLALFEEGEEADNNGKPIIRNPDPTIQMRYEKIIKYIKFMKEDMEIKSVDSISLEMALKFEVTDYLNILVKHSRVKKTPTGEFYI